MEKLFTQGKDENMKKEKKFKLHMPHVLTLIFFLIIVVAVLTWILPSGEFERTIMETSTGERSVAVDGTYHTTEKILEDGTDLRQGISQILMAPGRGIQFAIEVLAFVFIIGGVFQIMAKTNALNMGIQKIVKKLGKKEILIIPILMLLFGLGGSTFGMSDELVPFYLLIMPVMFAMGYDSMTTFMTVCLSATVGYAASTINPFSVLVAQGIAGIQGNPQLVFRMIQWVIMMAVVIAFVTWRAMKIKKDPEKSITYQDDIAKKKEMASEIDFDQDITFRQKLVLATFVIGMVLVVVGLVKFGWYMNELSMCFFGMGILMGIFGGLNEKGIAEEFITGVKDIAFAAMVIGFCSGIMVIAQDGMIIDTILNALSNMIANSNNAMFVGVMYVVQTILTLLVPSSSGLAALSMPVMAPLCDLHGVNPEAAVTVLQYANQLTNLMSPVAGTTVAGLAICKISFGQWWKTIWKVFLIMTVLAIVFSTISAGLA
jgi:Predicted membrane protein